MNEAVWKSIENLTISHAQLSRVLNYRYPKIVSRRKMKRLWGWQYMRSLKQKFASYSDIDIQRMKYRLELEIDHLLDKQWTPTK